MGHLKLIIIEQGFKIVATQVSVRNYHDNMATIHVIIW
jgi:hypothetical protein